MKRAAELFAVGEPQTPDEAGALIACLEAMPVCITRGGTPFAVMLTAQQYDELLQGDEKLGAGGQ